MPATLRQIAERCGVSRQTVVNYLKKLDLWESHVTRGVVGQASIVDDYAASAVAAEIGNRATSELQLGGESSGEDGSPNTQIAGMNEVDAAAFAGAWKDLCEGLRSQNADLQAYIDRLKAEINERDEEIGHKDQRISELSAQLTSSLATIKALPSADAVDDAKRAGEKGEREKIASMGFFQRRRYLKG